MSYQYDLFLSYKRVPFFEDWINSRFLPLLKTFLEEELGEVTIFQDTEEIQSGAAWENKIKHALAHSKCMLSIWTPSYFRSDFCMKEFTVFYHRQKQLGYMTTEQPDGLILPVNIHDGKHFPDFAKEINCTEDYRDFVYDGDVFRKSELYLEFQNKLIRWAEKVAMILQNVPDWDEKWLQNDWLDQPFQNFMKAETQKLKQPRL